VPAALAGQRHGSSELQHRLSCAKDLRDMLQEASALGVSLPVAHVR